MKIYSFVFCAGLMCLLLACEKETEGDFNYNLSSAYPTDSSLFITYDIDGVTYKYYQYEDLSSTRYEPIAFPDSASALYYYARGIDFDKFGARGNGLLYPKFVLIFYNYKVYDWDSVGWGIHDCYTTYLSEEIKLNYDYQIVCPPSNPNLNDSIFMKGVSLGEYTRNVMNEFNFNLASINEFYLNKSHLTISSIKSVGRNYYLVIGDFEAKGINYKNDTININNGHFEFLTK